MHITGGVGNHADASHGQGALPQHQRHGQGHTGHGTRPRPFHLPAAYRAAGTEQTHLPDPHGGSEEDRA